MRPWTTLNWAIVAAFLAAPAQAVVFGNAQDSADFPQGISSFADRVASFTIGTDVDPQFTDGANALGPPDVTFSNPFDFTSLGNGGVLILEFTDNFLTGSSDDGMADGIDDLFIFEVVVPESTFISVSADGTDGSFVDIGNLNPAGDGSVRNISIDIDAFGFTVDSRLRFVRIEDDATEIESSTSSGADIDAVGAISSMAIPIPAVAWLFPAGLMAGLGWMRRQRTS